MTGSVPYLVAGFVLTWGGLVLYAWRLEARVGDAFRRLERREEARDRPAADGLEDDTGPATPGAPTEETR